MKMRKIYLIISFLCGMLVLFAMYLAIIPAFLNSNFLFSKLQNKIYKNMGFELEITGKNFQTRIFPLSVVFDAEKISLLNRNNDEFVELNDVSADVKVLPLIILAQLQRLRCRDGGGEDCYCTDY